jgi:2-polyprenyl-3-methyl-5-hydroxy-6-metoxy-1,4-benzoquinol methylase
MVFSVIQQRQVTPELMDEPGIDSAVHDTALAGLGRLNRAAGVRRTVARPILTMARREGLRRLTVLDVACGGGDVPVGMAEMARRRGVEMELTVTDRSSTALQTAERNGRAAGIGVKTVLGAAPDGLPAGTFDVVTCSLFLHHLDERAVRETLRAMAARARWMVVVSDLRRSLAGWMLAWGACRILSRSEMVRHDGPVSVRAAWTMGEVTMMAAEAGLDGARVTRCWPQRMLLVWSPGRGSGP